MSGKGLDAHPPAANLAAGELSVRVIDVAGQLRVCTRGWAWTWDLPAREARSASNADPTTSGSTGRTTTTSDLDSLGLAGYGHAGEPDGEHMAGENAREPRIEIEIEGSRMVFASMSRMESLRFRGWAWRRPWVATMLRPARLASVRVPKFSPFRLADSVRFNMV